MFLGWCALLSAVLSGIVGAAPSSSNSTPALTVFYQNDGNWTNHVNTPSALFFPEPASYQQANATCSTYNETLLNCTQFSSFYSQFSYQQYLGNIEIGQALWSSCGSSRPVTWTGLPSTNLSSNATTFPFLCTNSAPLPTQVYTDYSVYPRVSTTVNGTTFQGLRDHMALRYLGIPYAQPPTGNLRFAYAQPWSGSYVDATKYGSACLQYGAFAGNWTGLNPWGNREDCLYLNVFTTSIPGSSTNSTAPLKPVMFWMHGGGQTSGTGSDSTFDGASLASRGDVVVVTINYRLNIFGYMSLNDSVVPGNMAVSDKIEALNWIQKYVRGFGGDPNNVTIFGQSAGGFSVIDLVASPKAAGLFGGAIVQSGGKGQYEPASVIAANISPYIQQHCNGTNSTGTPRLACLQDLSADTLLEISAHLPTWPTAVDGIYLFDYSIAQLAKGRISVNKVNFMAGFMPEESQSLLGTAFSPDGTNFTSNMQTLVEIGQLQQAEADAIIASNLYLVTNDTVTNGSSTYTNAYNASVVVGTDTLLTCAGAQLAAVGAASSSFESMWVYEHQRGYALSYYDFYNLCSFPVGQPETPYYRCHSADLYEVFGTYYLFGQPIRSPEDVYYTNAVQDMWASFARTGNPNVDMKYLLARGYNTTIDFFGTWQWPQFASYNQMVAKLQYPGPGYTTLPDQRQCQLLLPYLGI